MKRICPRAIIALLLLVGAGLAFAEVYTSGPLSVTATSQTVTFASRRTSVTVINNSTSANELYFRLFTNADTPAAATTSYVELKPGESIGFTFSPVTEAGSGYTAIALVCDTAETATARVVSK